ncbi:primosomal protein N' [Grimontia hollisae]|uniref:Replication restart protein PriA n=2 Tax=Grimontia hollisae TaxID=673 RepID=D0I3V7_GRIHO|nr:primosomal protein N' [Grimontia hollisae]AMG30417.1 primosomal protein N' [Grimontia hollisae]EEY73735.1 helicase PriA essential for oriC/DnaA-independent DNA replication [Grimontia hollisae CIP 101886]MDF2183870.1 primosomal protein N' [Grimontia hollisae]STO41998.1 Primosomal protein N' [Grimontia hollisae]STO55923.1 Primosomal protein N' [Grimontia hollisae]
MTPTIAQVALPVPLYKTFDYCIAGERPVVGGRVRVPFGKQYKVGVVTALTDSSDFPLEQLKPINAVLDTSPLWTPPLYKVLNWASGYYQYPLGDALATVMPGALRKGKPATRERERYWQLTETGKTQPLSSLSRAPKQARVLTLLRHGAMAHSDLLEEDLTAAVLKAVEEKGWIETTNAQPTKPWQPDYAVMEEKPRLNSEQAMAVATINANPDFACYLIEGVTGSGKTEVYLNLLEPVLTRGQQAMILVPEIGLTPQTINRFKRRFNVPVVVMHSALNDTERLNAWLAARDNEAAIIIGTRSALFTPCKSLGIIIVDEEHDASYKQQDSFRYHARDLAVMRGHEENIPVVLGSATPCLESLHNAKTGKYHHLILSVRAGNALKTQNGVLDIRGLYLEAGLSAPLIAEMRKHLSQGNQVMLFLNRRGYSPAMMCHECGWLAECQRCDAYYTLHQSSHELRCHHCGSQRPIPHQCGSCGSTQLISVGVGTEQLEAQLETLFPEYKTIRIDRDNTRRKGSLEAYLNAIHNKEYHILIGTQMLAKGHHFPDVTLVALVDVDSALFSNDFRAPERLAQLFIQVAGRAGRASKPGYVLLQTHHPEHALLQSLVRKGYDSFAADALNERKMAHLPPFSYFALIRAEAHHSSEVEQFLHQARTVLEATPIPDDECAVMGPAPAPLHRRAGRFRWQLVFQAPNRRILQQRLSMALPAIRQLPLAKKVRWSLDIEPQDMS